MWRRAGPGITEPSGGAPSAAEGGGVATPVANVFVASTAMAEPESMVPPGRRFRLSFSLRRRRTPAATVAAEPDAGVAGLEPGSDWAPVDATPPLSGAILRSRHLAADRFGGKRDGCAASSPRLQFRRRAR